MTETSAVPRTCGGFAGAEISATHPPVDEATGTELIKLLLQIVTADDVVSDAERRALDGAAVRLAGSAGTAVVAAALDQRHSLPAPNMGALRAHRTEVLVEVARVAGADGIHREELDLVKLIGEMLG